VGIEPTNDHQALDLAAIAQPTRIPLTPNPCPRSLIITHKCSEYWEQFLRWIEVVNGWSSARGLAASFSCWSGVGLQMGIAA